MPLYYQPVLVELTKIYLFFVWWECRNEKGKKKKNPSGMKVLFLFPCWQKGKRWLMYLLNLSGLTGLEPAASALTGRCSDQLNYNPGEIRRGSSINFKSFLFLFLRIGYFWRTGGLYHLGIYWRIVGPSWIWTSVDILPTNLQSVPINRSGIDPRRAHWGGYW